MADLIEPLYPAAGGPPLAWTCGVDRCMAVTRTRRGLVTHLWRKHKIKLQGELFDKSKPKTPVKK